MEIPQGVVYRTVMDAINYKVPLIIVVDYSSCHLAKREIAFICTLMFLSKQNYFF